MDQVSALYPASIFVGLSSSSDHELHNQDSSSGTHQAIDIHGHVSNSIEPVTTREQHISSHFPPPPDGREFSTTTALISLETKGPLDKLDPRNISQPPSGQGHLGDGASRSPFSDSKSYNSEKPERELQAYNLMPSPSVTSPATDVLAARSTTTVMTHHIASRYSRPVDVEDTLHKSTLNDCFVADITDLDQEQVIFDLDSLGIPTSGISDASGSYAPGAPYSAFSPGFCNQEGRIDADFCEPEDDTKESYQQENTVESSLGHPPLPSYPPTQIDDSRSNANVTSATTFPPCTPELKRVVGIEDGLIFSPPTSPSSSNHLPSSSPIPSSSPTGSRDGTPPTSPLNSPRKDSCILRRHELTCSKDSYGASGPDQNLQTEPELHTPSPGRPINLRESPHFRNENIPQETNPASNAASGQSLDPLVGLSDISGLKAIQPAPDNSLEEDISGTLPDSERITGDFQRSHLPTNSKNAGTMPYPKRSTLAHQRVQQRKLAQPFRSPLIKSSAKPSIQAICPTPVAVASFVPHQKKASSGAPSPPLSDTKIKHRTLRAASQFKSPLSSSDESILVRLTPTIQSLERKLQLLRRAVKVREDLQEDVLSVLVKKWTEAGREVAWEVWNLVKDNVDTASSRSSQTDKGKKRSFQNSWGRDNVMDQKRIKTEDRERNWGWDVVPISGRNWEEERPLHDHEEQAENQDSQEGEETPKHDIGALLIGLGIAPETLGWDEEEGTFVEK